MRKILTLLLLLGSLFMPGLAQAQTTEPPVIRNEAIVDYPQSVRFQLEVDPAFNVVDAVLNYDVTQTACLDVSTQVPVDVAGSLIDWEWPMVRSGNPPPGAELWWEWTLTDDQGNTTTTPRQTLTFSDDRFDWQTVQEGNVTLHWYAGDEVGPLLLDAAVSGLALLEEDMGIELQEPVELYIYGRTEDMRDAVLYIQDWAGGVAFAEYNTILIGVVPSQAEGWGRDTVRHELAHLVVGQYGRSCVGGHRPTWLEEGLAMYAEGEPSEQVLSDLERSQENNDFAALRSLNGPFPAHGDAAGSAYSQSYSVIQFLQDEYGIKKLQDLLLLIAGGTGTDAALEQVYGFNVDGLESEWRVWRGLPARTYPPTPTPLAVEMIPTVVPFAGPQDYPTPLPIAEKGVEETAVPQPGNSICALGLIPLFALAFIAQKSQRTKI
ncbi:MAG: hypothetical protein KDE48_11460 [Anaerolineales bacterium]|nr:hypothetical protein [Anaerolineales bacterium]